MATTTTPGYYSSYGGDFSYGNGYYPDYYSSYGYGYGDSYGYPGYFGYESVTSPTA
ncbi:hypothetical protein PI124_g24231 [Phytophthora idaei]|nr:hypothetical protein PI125_g26225 [Phytophthora idaei]KAG3122782.1 hypothetical protein PI126_g24004 [Phytophthora idaei]KAG3230673.1 hypothetical protein PI124_g24231 [Phytophthora idaei]